MSSTTSNLTNINFMSETRFDNLSQINDDEIYAVKVAGLYGEQLVNQNPNGNPVKVWTGTQAEYDLITPDANTIYNITDSNNGNLFMTLLSEVLYPVGSIYIGTMATCPLAALFGTWTLVSSGRVLQGADANHAAGTTIEPGLPNITGQFYGVQNTAASYSGAFADSTTTSGYSVGGGISVYAGTIRFKASSSNSIYGNSDTVQPPAFAVNIWKRTE